MKRLATLALLLSGGLLGASPTPAPAILCQTLREAAQPTLVGLIKNDGLLEQASRSFIASNGDRIALRSVTEGLAQNLAIVNRLLAQKFPPDANPTSFASEQLMKTRLQAIATAQTDALNMIEGYVEAEDMAKSQSDPDYDPDRHTPSDFRSVKDPAKPFVDTHINSPSRLLQGMRTQIGQLEDNAGIAIMSAVKVCNSSQTQ